jgi:formyl transferase-like protein
MLAGACDATNMVYHAIEPEMVILENHISRLSVARRRLKKLGWRKVAGQIAFGLLVVPYLARSSRKRIEEILRTNQLDASPIPAQRVLHVASMNDETAVAALRDAAPDIVVVNGTRIIGEHVLRAVSAPFVNLHTGITPLYRGVHGAYWALANNDGEHCGVTVHLVDSGIDTGCIVAQARIAPTPRDNFVTYPYLQVAAGIPLLKQALAGPLQSISPPAGKSRLWSHPTLWEYVRGGVR